MPKFEEKTWNFQGGVNEEKNGKFPEIPGVDSKIDWKSRGHLQKNRYPQSLTLPPDPNIVIREK